MDFFSWNTNGLGGNRLEELVNVLELHHFPKIVFLQETHSNSVEVIKQWKIALSVYNCYFNFGDGRNRGTGILIHKNLQFKLLLEIQDWEDGRFSIIKGTVLGKLSTFVSVYAPIPNNEKPWFFEKILACNLEGIKIIMGDFNGVSNPTLDRASVRKTYPVKAIVDFIDFTDTFDTWRYLFPNRRQFTYGNTSRIDFGFLSMQFQDNLVEAGIGPKYFSDHSLITFSVKFGENVFGKDFQKIRPSTISADGYDAVFYHVWNRSLLYFRNELKEKLQMGTFSGNPVAFLNATGDGFDYTNEIILDNLTLGPEWWDTFKREILECSLVFQRKNFSLKKQNFQSLQREFYRLPENSPDRSLVESRLNSLLKDISKEFNFQKQKDERMTHERFSAGFFKQAYKDRKAGYISKLVGFNGELLTNREDIQNHLQLQYFYLYQGDTFQRENLHFFLKYIPKLRSKEDITPFTFSEASAVFRQTKNCTCPGPDGIPVEFYKKYFHVFGHFYVKMLNNCLRDGVVPLSWKTSILKVIPKVPDQIPSFDTLRPITLGNVDCKNQAGMLVKRMSKVADGVIHGLQTGGLPNRQIQDTTFLIHLLINLYKEKNWSGYIAALDNFKAFDKLIRDFMWVVLDKMGFDQWTLNAIKNMYQETSVKLILSGFLSDSFPVESGVKQGCPLSPLLFALTMEPLARSILDDPEFQGYGFRLPGKKEVRLVQHLDDMTLFCHNAYSFTRFFERILKYNKLSGAVINYAKSFLIRLDTTTQFLVSDGPLLCNIKILEPHENRKILGIFFGSDVNKYVKENWRVAKNKCLETLNTWKICFSSGGFTSLMGRALVVHVMVHSKLIYLMQCMQFYSDTIDEINSAVQNFLWAGKTHMPKIGLKILEAPVKLGGIGLKPLDCRAISLRFRHIKYFFSREGDNWMEGKSHAESIICHVLDLSVRHLAPHLERSKMASLLQASMYHKPGSIQFIGHLPPIFHILYWDLERAVKVMGSADYLENYSSSLYLNDLMERRTVHLRQGTLHKAFISRYQFSPAAECVIWNNINLKLLQPKIRAFAFKLAHNSLPTKYNIWRIMRHFRDNQSDPYCMYCLAIRLTSVPCTAEHIFINCPVAQHAWTIINRNLQMKGHKGFVVSENVVFFRHNLRAFESYFITEFLWSLWRVNNHNNYEISVAQPNLFWTHENALRLFKDRISFVSRIDRDIYSDRAFFKKWKKINDLFHFVFDTG